MQGSPPLRWKKDAALAELSCTFPDVADLLARPVGSPSASAIHAEVIHRHGGPLFHREVMGLPAPLGALPAVLAHLSQRWLGAVAATPRGYAVVVRFRAGHSGPEGYVPLNDGPGLDSDAITQRVRALLNQETLSPAERTCLVQGWGHEKKVLPEQHLAT